MQESQIYYSQGSSKSKISVNSLAVMLSFGKPLVASGGGDETMQKLCSLLMIILSDQRSTLKNLLTRWT